MPSSKPLTPGGAGASAWLALRSIMWTMAIPGMVAGYVPWRVYDLDAVGWRGDLLQIGGALLAIAGAALLGACIWEFARRGRGTLSGESYERYRASVGRWVPTLRRAPVPKL